MTYDANVIFNQGSPIDLDQLRKLQNNIDVIRTENSQNIQNATVKINGIDQVVRVIPNIYSGSTQVTISGRRGTKPVEFGGINFTNIPQLVATVSTNVSPDDGIGIRATARSKTGGDIEVFISKDSKLTAVDVNFIAIEMKPID